MTKNELIAAIAEKTGKAKTDVSAILAAKAEITMGALKGGDAVVDDLGKLSAGERKAREGRNLHTGATIHIAAKTVVKFKPAKSFADAVA